MSRLVRLPSPGSPTGMWVKIHDGEYQENEQSDDGDVAPPD
jgi:hypothetical protein